MSSNSRIIAYRISSSPRISMMDHLGIPQGVLEETSTTFPYKETSEEKCKFIEGYLKSKERTICVSVKGTVENIQVEDKITDETTENERKNMLSDTKRVVTERKSEEDDCENIDIIYCVKEKIEQKVSNTNTKAVDPQSQNISSNEDKSTKKKTRVSKNQNPSIKNRKENTEPTKRMCKKFVEVRGTLFIIGDSHVRQLKDLVQEQVDDKTNIVSHFQGGASLMQICNYLKQSVSIGDHVFVFGGTNDIDRNSFSTLKPALLKLLTQYPKVKFTFILVPLRVHWNREYYQNSSIFHFNENLVYFLKELNRDSIDIIDTNQILHARHYSRDGIHLNTDGKKAVSSAIATVFLS